MFPGLLKEQIRDERMDPVTFDSEFDYRLVLQYEDSHGVLERIADSEISVDQIEGTTASVRNMLAAYKAIQGVSRCQLPERGTQGSAVLRSIHAKSKTHPHCHAKPRTRPQGIRDDQ